MRIVENIYIAVIELIVYIILFFFMCSTILMNVSERSFSLVDIMTLLFNTVILICILEHVSTIRLYMRLVREKSHDVASDK